MDFDANTLIIISSEDGQGPVNVQHVSDFGEDESEVMFTLGQQFLKESVEMRRCRDVWKELGVEDGCNATGTMRVIKLTAVDKFFELAKDIYRDGGTAMEALEVLRKRVEYEERKYGENDEHVAYALFFLSNAANSLRILDVALSNAERAYRVYQHCHGEDHVTLCSIDTLFGSIYSAQRNYDESVKYYQKALASYKVHRGEDHIETANTMGNLAVNMMLGGKLDDALELHQTSLKILLKHFGENHMDTARSYRNISDVYREMGRHADAVEWCLKAKKMDLRLLGAQHPESAECIQCLAFLYFQADQFEDALPNYRECKAIYEACFGLEHDKTQEAVRGLEYCEWKVDAIGMNMA